MELPLCDVMKMLNSYCYTRDNMCKITFAFKILNTVCTTSESLGEQRITR